MLKVILITIVISSFVSTILARLVFDYKCSSDIGSIVVDEDEIYLSFNDEEALNRLRKLDHVTLDVITHKKLPS